MSVEFRQIEGAPGYEVGSDGSVKSVERVIVKTNGRGGSYLCRLKARTLKPWIAGFGYHYVQLGAGGLRNSVHRLVCTAFHGAGQDGKEVGHLDGNCLNNNAANLVWVTHSENEKHKQAHGTAPDYGKLRWVRQCQA